MTAPMLGTFEEHVLLSVVRVEHAFGMQVRRELEVITERQVAIGAVYATLDRLEAKGLVRSSRETVEGRSRRIFRIQRAGLAALATTRRIRQKLWHGVELKTV